MSERLSITPLGPYIGAQISGADLTRPLSDNQFEQLYHAVLRHQVVFLRDQAITPQQQRALAQRFGELHIHPVYPHAEGVDEIIVLDTHNDNPPDNDNWHTDVTFIETPPAGAILAAKELPSTGGDTLWTSGIAAYEALSVPFRQLLSGLRAEHDFRKSFPEYKYRKTEEEHQRWREAVAKNPFGLVTAVGDGEALITATTPDGHSACCNVYCGTQVAIQEQIEADEVKIALGVLGGFAVLVGALALATK